MKIPIYLDYCSTTPIDHKVLKKMKNFLYHKKFIGNPSSKSNYFSWKASEKLDIARNKIASILKTNFRNIIFTSGATESNNLAIKGIADFYKKRGKHIITGTTEHKSIINTCKYLQTKGFKITFLKPNKTGIFSLTKISQNITKKTILITLMHVNNETGIIQNIKKIGNLCKKKKIFFHVDACQSFGKIPINLSKLSIDLMSFSGHKIYGPQGIGILYIKKNVFIKPQIHGGNQEFGIRSGTVPIHLAIGISKAFEIANNEIKKNEKKIKILKEYLWKNIKNIPGIKINCNSKNSISSILNISFNNTKNKYPLVMYFKKIAISSNSACNSKFLEYSHVLRELNIKKKRLHNSLRISLGKYTTIQEIHYTIHYISKIIKKLKK